MPKPNVITVSEAARVKGCTTQGIYLALNRDELSEVRMGGTRLVIKDERFRDYQVREFGGRLHKKYQEKQQPVEE